MLFKIDGVVVVVILYFDDSHRDPFDRYLIATAHFENLAIITKDEKFSLYENRYPIIW